MAEITLVAETGRPIGSRPAGRLRTSGKVPGVVYGHGAEPVSVAVDWRELRHALTTDAGMNALINLDIDGDAQLTIVKEMQRDPVRRKVLHVDFLRISRDIAITVDVPVTLTGEAEALLREDGIVEHVLHELSITAKPGAIPNEITVDISALEIGDTIRVGDLPLPAGVTTEVDPEDPVVIGASPVAEELPEEEEAEEGEAAEGVEGAERESTGGEPSGEE